MEQLRIGIVGAGRVGAVLGAAFVAAGHRVVAVSASSLESRRRAASLLSGTPISDDPVAVVAGTDLALLAVPDDALSPLVEALAAAGSFTDGQLVVQVAGSWGVAALVPAARDGARAIALHPAMTFTGTADDLPRLVGCPVAVTAIAADLPIAEELARQLGGAPFRLAEADRIAYHAGLAHAANHLVTLISQGREVLAGAGVPDPSGVLRPLLEAALDNTLRLGDAALTGPVARGDAGTVARHLAVLTGETANSYRALARATTLRGAADGRIPPAAADALLRVLAAPGGGDGPGRPAA